MGTRLAPGAAPEPAVVAVGIDPERLVARRPALRPGGDGEILHAAVLALELERAADLAGEDEAVRVDDRHDEDPRAPQQPGDPRVAGAQTGDEVDRPLHRQLSRRPLARVVHAHDQERRTPVAGSDVLGDLDALDGAAGERGVRQREGAHGARVGRRELLEVGLVVGERAVAAAPAGQRVALGAGSRAGGRRAQDAVAQPGPSQRSPVGGRVQDHVARARAAVLGDVETERDQGVGRRPRGHRHPSGARLPCRLGGQRRGIDPDAHLPRAGEPARLHDDPLARPRGRLRDLVRVRAGGGADRRAPVRVEQREVPVARAAVHPGREQRA